MRTLLFSLWVGIALSKPAPPRQPRATNIYDTGVTYEGVYADKVEAFLGIRYADNTGGQNRFKPPVPYTPSPRSTIAATAGGPACPQALDTSPPSPLGLGSPPGPISEDCLRLNVWRPNGTQADDKLPVLVFIHGGSFINGGKDAPLYRPGGLILQSKAIDHPIIHVELNYRLGVFGFATTHALESEHSLNAGVLDQRAALDWVHENIAAFGGDPDNVAIHGQSSGGLGVGLQILAYGGKKPTPFKRAICESEVLDLAITSNVTRVAMMATWSNTTCSNEAFDSAANIKCLRGLSTEALLDAQNSYAPPGLTGNGGDFWLPVVDGDFLPDAPSVLAKQGRFAKGIDTIIGWAQDDATFFVDASLVSTPQDTRKYIHGYIPDVTPSNLDKLFALYPSSDFKPLYYPNGTLEVTREVPRAGRIIRDLVFTCQPILFGDLFHAQGSTIYLYDQNQTLLTSNLEAIGDYGYGVPHTSELVFVFGNISKYDIPGYAYHPTPEDFRLEKQESGSWAAFTATGNPSLKGNGTIQHWAPADFDDPNYGVFVIGGPSEGYSGQGGNPETQKLIAAQKLRERCDFLNSPELVKQLGY